jgi:molybdopterin-guanine dinucleotide biosynthesis protein A
VNAPAAGSRCVGVILAGGLASRFGGRPKGLESVGGIRIIDRVAASLRGVTDELLVIANTDAASGWLPGVPVATDVRPGLGSLGGLHAALVRAAAPVLVVAWDMPFVPAGLLAALRHLGEQGFDAAVPESGSPRGLEPLCAYYAPTCVLAIEQRLDAGDRRVIGFFDEVRVARLTGDVVRRFGDPDHIFMNVNEPADLEPSGRSTASPTR